ncbi:MAG TPA: beta-propeller domain-containing protein [Kofleriaceae bacterium]|nr:beta-propeller domain-containing protein [Kofleriaceae bacterium]
MLVLGLALAGCGTRASNDSNAAGGAGAAGAAPPPMSSSGGDAGRAILEADIIQVLDGRLYAMSKSGSVSVIDVSVPGQLALLGQTRVPGQPFEMYLRGDVLLAMANTAVEPSGSYSYGSTATDSDASAQLIAIDVGDPAHLTTNAQLDVPGEIADSRIVGNVLYLATYENAACYGCGTTPRTLVTSFDITDPHAAAQVDQAAFQSNAPDAYNLPWGMNWKRSIVVNDQRLYIGGHADVDPSTMEVVQEGIIDVLDITDPAGHLGKGERITTAGAILSRWQIDETDGILRVISQYGAGRSGNGLAMPLVQTFRIASTQSFMPLGHTTIELPMQEGLRSVRFDGNRAYAITYNQTDPLFVIDMTDPASPQQRGELYMPGFMYYLEPHGQRVIGLGIDRSDPKGSLNVSLFDTSNADAPKLLSRASFATAEITEDYEILNGEVSEDQDRIQKAFHVFDDGLVVVPFTALQPYYQTQDCTNAGGGVQLVQWANDTLTDRALLQLPGNPRRAFELSGEMVTVSDSNVRAFSLADTVVAAPDADLVIDTCTPDDPTGGYNQGGFGDGVGVGDEVGGGEYSDGYGCSASRGGGGGFVLIGLGLALSVRRRRRGIFR